MVPAGLLVVNALLCPPSRHLFCRGQGTQFWHRELFHRLHTSWPASLYDVDCPWNEKGKPAASVVDTSVKWAHSGQIGSPVPLAWPAVVHRAAGRFSRHGLRSPRQSIDSLVVVGGAATITVTGTHSAQVDTVILVAGVTNITAPNGEQKRRPPARRSSLRPNQHVFDARHPPGHQYRPVIAGINPARRQLQSSVRRARPLQPHFSKRVPNHRPRHAI